MSETCSFFVPIKNKARAIKNVKRSYQERALPTELCGRWFHYTDFYNPLSSPAYVKLKNYGGGGRIRTCVALRAADLQSAPINHSGTPPAKAFDAKYQAREGIRTH